MRSLVFVVRRSLRQLVSVSIDLTVKFMLIKAGCVSAFSFGNKQKGEIMLFSITAAFGRVTDISPELLGKLGIKGLIIDIDNTLAGHNDPMPADGVEDWIGCMRDNGIRLILMSNNFYLRVKLFADLLGLDYVCESKKPFVRGYRIAAMKMGLPRHALAAVGDQVLTDVLGANLFRIKMLYTLPIGDPKSILFRIRKKLESPFIPRRIYCSDRNKLKDTRVRAIAYSAAQEDKTV